MSIEAKFLIERSGFRLDARFSCPSQGVTAIFGPSGCGKTTLLRAIAGLERTHNGYLNVSGNIWQDKKVFIKPHRRPLGYVFQEANLFPHLSVRQNLEYGFKRVPRKQRQVAFDTAVELLGVVPLLKRKTTTLSGGERQRIAIARALLTSPRLLLMDEPMAALDLKSKAEIFPFLERLHTELDIPVLYVSHLPEEISRIADSIVLMEAGRVQASGSISSILTRMDLPLAHGSDASSLVEAKVVGYDKNYDLTYLKFPGGTFTISHKQINIGQQIRLRLLARDVSITLAKQENTSILNIFPAVVEEISEENTAKTILRLNVAGVIILSRITHKSAELLRIKPGSCVYAQVKSIAIT